MKRLLLSLVLLAALSSRPAFAAENDIAWVWHANQAPLAAQHIALLLDHFVIGADGVTLRPRRRAVFVPPQVLVTPVIHAQMEPGAAMRLSPQHQAQIIKAVLGSAADSTSGWVQLDFEVTKPHREAWLALVSRVKRALPRSVRLSVTMQAHWCLEPALVQSIEADEIVPMFFHTGDSLGKWWENLRETKGLSAGSIAPACLRGAAGFSTRDPPPTDIQQRFQKRYWFPTRSTGVDTREREQ